MRRPPAVPRLRGTYMVCSDLHIPYHDPHALEVLCNTAEQLGIHRLIIAGDLVHADSFGRFDSPGPQVQLQQELNAAHHVMSALLDHFDDITVIMGNHDQRLERVLSRMQHSDRGQNALDLLRSVLGLQDTACAADVAMGVLARFLSLPGVKLHSLPDLMLNDTWLVQHPGGVSRVSPSGERKMAAKHRKCIVSGHSHLWALGFDDSATDLVFNCGHMCDDSKFRYVRELPTSFPKSVRGFCAIFDDDDGGFLWPFALHKRYFSLDKLERYGIILSRANAGPTQEVEDVRTQQE